MHPDYPQARPGLRPAPGDLAGCARAGQDVEVLNAKRMRHRPVASMPNDVASTVSSMLGAIVWPPPDGTRYVSLAAYRPHSASLSPNEWSFVAREPTNTDGSTTPTRPSSTSALHSATMHRSVRASAAPGGPAPGVRPGRRRRS